MEKCPECGSMDVTEKASVEKLRLLDPTLDLSSDNLDGLVDIEFVLTWQTCGSCSLSWTDIVGEAERSEAALHYSQRRMRELYTEVQSLRAFKRSVDESLNSGDGSYRP